jgi:hypothetical protein
MATNNTYTNIKDILTQFELQVVKQKHYTKGETMTSDEITTAISNAIAGVDQMHIVIASNAGTTPKDVEWTSGSTTITGTLTAAAANKHTLYYVKSNNGTGDAYDEYMALKTGTDTYAWEKIGNTDVDLSNYVKKTTTVNGHALSSNVTVTKSDVGLGNVNNVSTVSSITSGNGNNVTSGAVYTALNAAFTESSSNGITLKGKVNAPELTITTGNVVSSDNKVVTGSTVYTYLYNNMQPRSDTLTAIASLPTLTGTASGFLKKDGSNSWSIDKNSYVTNTELSTELGGYLTKQEASDTYAEKYNSVFDVRFNSTEGLTYFTVAQMNDAEPVPMTIASISTLKEGLGINNVTNVATTDTVTSTSTNNISSKGVYNYISGSSGVLYMSDTDFSDILAAV